jgi:type III restriction enzyme
VLELFQFQRAAASQIADRFVSYSANPATTGRRNDQRDVPFYQALSAITGSGKTAVLAQAVGEVSAMTDPAPVVLWLSKGKVVVAQSYANLSAGGKYNHLLGDSTVRLLSEYRPEDVAQASEASVYFATVGTFNQRDRESSTLRVYRSEIDTTETSTWEALKERRTGDGTLRPLVVVYDEAQNLSDQQTELLLELKPAAFLLASATLRFPQRFSTEVIDPLRANGISDAELITSIPSGIVVESGLVKSTITLEGLNSPMEESIAAMLADMGEAEAYAAAEGLSFKPKAIYVSNTNVVDGDDGLVDDPKRPFAQRQAPPILIWRYLTAGAGIPAAEVAVYADLKTHKDFPLPADFNLFSGGESDYERFTEGNFRHIIFNLALQEGWDDPEAYFAYVDKSMNSRVQVTQIVGRVLRQPGATHYSSETLNTAHFYVRLDRNSVFTEVVDEVRDGLGGDAPEVRLVATAPGRERPVSYSVKDARSVPKVALASSHAQSAVESVIAKLNDYSADATNTRATGSRRTVTQRIGDSEAVDSEWMDFEHASRVSVRWAFRREVSRSFRPALTVVNTDGAKFDAKVGVGSTAYKHVVDISSESVAQFLDFAQIKQQRRNPYQVGSILARPGEVEPFTNALHEGYDGLNKLEMPFAQALDATGLPWCRNPSQTGYKIPLLSPGVTVWFFPDFLLWAGNTVFCLDTKGEHLIGSDAGRKLLGILPAMGSEARVEVKLVSRGRWDAERTRTSPDGCSLWGVRHDGKPNVTHFDDVPDVISAIIAMGRT